MQSHPTKRALDAGDSAAFSGIFPWPVGQDRLASGFSCSQAESTPAPPLLTQTVPRLSCKIDLGAKTNGMLA